MPDAAAPAEFLYRVRGHRAAAVVEWMVGSRWLIVHQGDLASARQWLIERHADYVAAGRAALIEAKHDQPSGRGYA